MYSTQEVGYITLQCPKSEHHHVQAEGVFIEILDDNGSPCRPGEMGKVIATPLHNLAMPLIRYDVGDYAEFGEPCPCGRGLPVLRRIMGRSRNLLRLPSGERIFPYFHDGLFREIAPVRQFQVVQIHPQRFDVRLVTERPLTPRNPRFST